MRVLCSKLDRALADWLANGGSRIGQLTVQSQSGDAFELRHRDDWGSAPAALTTHSHSEDAVALALYDDAGNYRPLKTAPNLRRGWRLVLTGGVPVLRLALDGFYPARLGAFVAWKESRLATTTLRETLSRQTGMYRVTQRLSDSQADALVGSFCRSEGGCLRTIFWKRDASGAPASTLLPPEKFDPAHDQTGCGEPGVLPLLCQEACNLLVAEARTVVKAAK